MGASLFLYLDGIPGDSTDSEHKGEIDIQSFSWGARGNPGAGGGGGTGKGSLNSINCVKSVDVASPSLAQAAATGRPISQAIFYSRPDSQTDERELVLTLTDVTVSSYQASGNPPGDQQPSESIGLAFTTFELKYAHLTYGPVGGLMSYTRDP